MSIYPQSVHEVIDSSARYRPATLSAVRQFARSKPWQGDLAARRQKFQELNRALGEAYGVEPPLLILAGKQEGDSGSSSYCPTTNTITMRGRLSVITFLHEWGHRLYGPSEYKACRWSLNLFRKVFKKSWSRLSFEGHVARRVDSL